MNSFPSFVVQILLAQSPNKLIVFLATIASDKMTLALPPFNFISLILFKCDTKAMKNNSRVKELSLLINRVQFDPQHPI